ncbi:CsgG/HfaB family protein [Sphingomonas kyeonggiensis]|uniref:Curli biogenesis system outer membrane secretion channel CsgG n=1 Tax=Sphingomonas kyeonggiensis TaxID=1268553 RepID=A0A7W6JVS3_9SPHN|nr:CsgG/HfaB family protein [Sphingomonas kyeonggiensis]MBB4100468.1 curli biogenesis system outer membrane secretion channel CsgG [Sphingomonas kyeonggiensis]
MPAPASAAAPSAAKSQPATSPQFGQEAPATPSAEQRVREARAIEQAVQDVPRCTHKHGTIAIVDGDDPTGWARYQLAAPAKLLRVMVQRSGCFNIIDRGMGLQAASRERPIGGDHGLYGTSSIGQGQVKAADYVLLAEVQRTKYNGNGSGVGGVIGGVVSGRVGAIVGSVNSRKLEANTSLSLVSIRTTETLSVQEGYASKKDLRPGTRGDGGFLSGTMGAVGAVGGGYDSTDIGRVMTLSFIQAYSKMVTELDLVAPAVRGTASSGRSNIFVAEAPVSMRSTPAATGKLIRILPVGSPVYPTGLKNGLWWEVADANDNVGWVLNTKLRTDSGDAGQGAEEQFLPWPPPRPSSMGDVSANFRSGAVIGDYNEQIKALLARKGYARLHYFSVRATNGFGITTDVERLDDKGGPHPKRWMLKTPPAGGFLEYVTQLLKGDTGRFRVFVFIVSDQDPNPNTYDAQQVDLTRWKNNGKVALSATTSRRVAPPALKVWLLVYEFVANNSKSAELVADNDGAYPFSLHSAFLGFR